MEPKFHEYDFKPKGITCDGVLVKFPDLFEPMALALANDGQLMVADSQTSPRQQVLFYDVTDMTKPKLTRVFGDYSGIASGKPGEVTPTKFWGIRGIGMDAAGNIYVAMSEMGSCLRKFSPDGKLLWELRGTTTKLIDPFQIRLNSDVPYPETNVRYFLADMYLGGSRDFYHRTAEAAHEMGCKEAVARFDAGVGITNLDQFERKKLDGKVIITRKGSNERISGMAVKLSTDLE